VAKFPERGKKKEVLRQTQAKQRGTHTRAVRLYCDCSLPHCFALCGTILAAGNMSSCSVRSSLTTSCGGATPCSWSCCAACCSGVRRRIRTGPQQRGQLLYRVSTGPQDAHIFLVFTISPKHPLPFICFLARSTLREKDRFPPVFLTRALGVTPNDKDLQHRDSCFESRCPRKEKKKRPRHGMRNRSSYQNCKEGPYVATALGAKRAPLSPQKLRQGQKRKKAEKEVLSRRPKADNCSSARELSFPTSQAVAIPTGCCFF
jgi:hypothetical protein